MKKFVFVVVHTRGEYSDYFESTIGIYENEADARQAARQAALKFNYTPVEERYTYYDEIILRSFPLNTYLVDRRSVAEQMAGKYGALHAKHLYRLVSKDGLGMDEMFTEVPEDEQ